MHVLEITSATAVNGAARHCLLLGRELARRGHRVSLLCRRGSWIDRQASPGPMQVLHSDLERWPADELRRVARWARREAVDILHTHMSRAHFFGVLLRAFSRLPCVATAHSRFFQPHWMFNDLVIAASQTACDYHRRWNLVRSSRIVTIHNFIDEARFDAVDGSARQRIREGLGAGEGDLLLGAVGDIVPRKGQLHLVRALPRVLASFPTARVVLVGQPMHEAYCREVQAETARLGLADRVLWTGCRADVPDLLAGLDLCVLPSLEETFPLALLEAMAAGRAVVATTVGGNAEAVIEGLTGLLVPPADPGALARAILALLEDPDRRARMGVAARARVREHFSARRAADGVEEAFRLVLRRRAQD